MSQNSFVDQPHLFKIMRETSTEIFIQTEDHLRLVFRRAVLQSEAELQYLQRRIRVQHEALACLYKIEFDPVTLHCGVLFEAGSKKLNEALEEFKKGFGATEIINTFEPIVQALHCLAQHQCFPAVTADSIVWTESNQIKFIEGLVSCSPSPKLHTTVEAVFKQLLNLCFQILLPNCKSKSWKIKLKAALDMSPEEQKSFWISLVSIADPSWDQKPQKKTKKIKKSPKAELKKVNESGKDGVPQKARTYMRVKKIQEGKENIVTQ